MPTSDTPTPETPATETTATETAATETAATETSATETSATETAATETPPTETPPTETAATETPPPESLLRENLLRLTRLVLRSFFRKIEVVGLENVPTDRGGILVSWHVSGVVDPALLVATFPQRVVFGARDGLLKIPLIGRLMAEMGTVPIYRAADLKDLSVGERRAKNAGSLDALAEQVAAGSFAALFPEGETHDNPHLSEVKSGAARFYYRSRQLQQDSEKPPVILPIGLFYDDKTLWRSDVMIQIHPPLELPKELDFDPAPDATPESLLPPARALRDLLGASLREAVHATESWELHHLMMRAASLVRSVRVLDVGVDLDPADFRERVEGMGHIWRGYERHKDSDPERIAALWSRIATYDAELRALGLTDADLDHPPALVSPSMVFLLLLQLAGLVFVMPPILILGFLINYPATIVGWAATKRFSRSPRDDATVKIMVGMLTYPLSWIGAGLGAYFAADYVRANVEGMPDAAWMVGLLVATLGILGGAALLRYLRGLRGTWHSLQVRLTRAQSRRSLERLKLERTELYGELMALSE